MSELKGVEVKIGNEEEKKVSEILKEQLKELCETQSKVIRKFKEGKTSSRDMEVLELSNKLISEKMEQMQKSKHLY